MEYAQMAGFFILMALVLFANGNDVYRWLFLIKINLFVQIKNIIFAPAFKTNRFKRLDRL